MLSNKTFAFALCLAVTGCAQTSQNGAADGSINWWPFGAHEAASKPADQTAAAKPEVKADAPAAPVAAKPAVAAAPSAPGTATAPVVAAAAPATEKRWWWPFDTQTKQEKDAAKPLLAVRAQPVAMPDPKVTQAWLDDYEPRLRVAIKDSPFELERRENLLIITAPADSSFNHDRPTMLLPVTLGPISRLAKIVEADPTTAVLVLGHADTAGISADSDKLTQDRASSVAAIFRMSGLQRNRLGMKGMGSIMPRAANDSVEGRKLNRRIEIVMTPQVTMVALLSKYNMPAPGPLLAVAQVQAPVAATPAPAAKPAATGKKAVPTKKAAAKKPVAKKAAPVKKTKAAAPKTDAPVKKDVPDDQAKAN